jgi:voltage-gated potassium channel
MRVKQSHILICGWNESAPKIIGELRSPVVREQLSIVVVSDTVREEEIFRFKDVYLVRGSGFSREALVAAGVDRASRVLILADFSRDIDPDAGSILTTLAVKKLNSAVHTLVEVVSPGNLIHFKRARADELVSTCELSVKLLAQAAMSHGLSWFFLELFTFQEEGQEIYRLLVPATAAGVIFSDISDTLLDGQIIPVGVITDRPHLEAQSGLFSRSDLDNLLAEERPAVINPPPGFELCEGDALLVMALEEPKSRKGVFSRKKKRDADNHE